MTEVFKKNKNISIRHKKNHSYKTLIDGNKFLLFAAKLSQLLRKWRTKESEVMKSHTDFAGKEDNNEEEGEKVGES